MDKIIADTLKEIGIQPGLLGYTYLKCAVKLAMDDSSVVHNVTKVLYPRIAKRFDTTPSRVERAMRHAIERTWDMTDSPLRDTIFSNTLSHFKGKPTNGHFVAAVAEYLAFTQEEGHGIKQ